MNFWCSLSWTVMSIISKIILPSLLNCYIIVFGSTGQTDADLRTVFSNRGAIGVSCDELDVVCKDF